VEKKLFILRAIDEYNHYMNGVDRNDQLRKHLSVHRAFEHRVWVPQLYFMIDICSINSYLIWKNKTRNTSHHDHHQYHSTLAQACLQIPYPDKAIATANSYRSSYLPSINVETPSHAWERWEKRGHCVWCRTHVEKWVPKRPSVLQEIVNEAPPKKRTRQSQS
jgi:Transposase IS4